MIFPILLIHTFFKVSNISFNSQVLNKNIIDYLSAIELELLESTLKGIFPISNPRVPYTKPS